MKLFNGSLTLTHLKRFPLGITRFHYVWIWTGEHNAWWRPEGSGYTTDIRQAGVYQAQDAFDRVKHCGPEKKIKLVAVPSHTAADYYQKIEAENTKYRKALEFYSEPNNWGCDGSFLRADRTNKRPDAGQAAREALGRQE